MICETDRFKSSTPILTNHLQKPLFVKLHGTYTLESTLIVSWEDVQKLPYEKAKFLEYFASNHSVIPEYPLLLNDTYWDYNKIKEKFIQTEGYRFSQTNHVPLVVSEFSLNVQHVNKKECYQIRAFADQLKTYNQYGVHWTFWTYKDVGEMGWLQVDPQSAYLCTIKPVIVAKEVLQTDLGWLRGFPPEVQQHISALSNKITSFIPGLDLSTNQRYFAQAAMSTYTADQLQILYVRQFVDKSEKEIDEILRSFRIENCIQNEELNTFIKTYLREKI